MKFTCSKETLINNMNLAYRAVSSRKTLPILDCILLNLDKDGLKITSNNLELGIQTSNINVCVEEEGSIALEAKIFSDIIKKLPDNNEITIYSNKKNLITIKSGKTEFKLNGQSYEDFPLLPIIEKGKEYKILRNEFKNMIKQTIFSVSLNENKPILTGELIEIENGKLNVVAVDNFRVSLRVTNIETKNDNISAVIPSKSLSELSKILATDNNSFVSIYFTDKHVLFEIEECCIVSRVLEGEFLKYKQIFTEDYKTIIYVNKQDILLALERSSLLSKENKKVPVKIKIKNDNLILTAETDMGTSYDEVLVEMDGDNLEIAFNPKYLIDAIRVIDEEKISIQFTTELSPCIVKGYNTEIYKYLILPLKLKE